MATYINAFYSRTALIADNPRVYETDAKPETYRGFEIYKRLPKCHDLVLNGVCIANRVGRRGCTMLADSILDDPDSFWANRAMRYYREAAHD